MGNTADCILALEHNLGKLKNISFRRSEAAVEAVSFRRSEAAVEAVPGHLDIRRTIRYFRGYRQETFVVWSFSNVPNNEIFSGSFSKVHSPCLP